MFLIVLFVTVQIVIPSGSTAVSEPGNSYAVPKSAGSFSEAVQLQATCHILCCFVNFLLVLRHQHLLQKCVFVSLFLSHFHCELHKTLTGFFYTENNIIKL